LGTVWSYPNLHGDEVVTADNSGTRVAGHASYDLVAGLANWSRVRAWWCRTA